MAEDLYKAFGDNTLSWVCKANGKVYGNSIAITPGKANLYPIERLMDDIRKTTLSILAPKNLSHHW